MVVVILCQRYFAYVSKQIFFSRTTIFVLSMRNRTSDLRIPRSNALPLSHRDSTVSAIYYDVHMSRVLHTARISNVDSVMFVDRNKRGGKF